MILRATPPHPPPTPPLPRRSLYVICLLLCVEGALFGFTPVHEGSGPGDGRAVHAGSGVGLGGGDGALEEGLLAALQSMGDSGLDAFVLKRDWPPVDNARRFRKVFGFLLQ